MKNFNDIYNDVKETVIDLYKKPSEGVSNDGLKGGIRGLGSATGSVVEHFFTVPIDVIEVVADKLKKKSSENKSENDDN